MYIQEPVTLQELAKLKAEHLQPSEKALRKRADEKLLVYLDMRGASKLYDKQLSLVRCKAATLARSKLSREKRMPWGTVARTFRRLDIGDVRPAELVGCTSLNDWIKGRLNSNSNTSAVAEKLAEVLFGLMAEM